jgi:hypothetical protein
MSTVHAPIAGLSTQAEAPVATTWPAITCTSLGRLLNQVVESIPVRLGGIKLSHLLFALPLAPLGALLYLLLKATGEKYQVTNRALHRLGAFSGNKIASIPLAEIDAVDVEDEAAQRFSRAGDLVIRNARGEELFRLRAVMYPHIFRNTILEARDARLRVDESLQTIRNRR